MKKKAFITGITGQDGSYLAELLLEKGYEVHGLVRRSSTGGIQRLQHLAHDPHLPETKLTLHHGDLTDGAALAELILRIAPDEIYNLGAQSHVRVSFEQPVYTLMTIGVGLLHILEAARQLQPNKPTRVYQAGSSEMFGKAVESPQNEETPFNPQSPYACAKSYAHQQAVNYRDSYGVFITNGILFNHESPRRGETFVTRKITRAAARIKMGLQDKLYLGNLDARRDWGYAKEYCEAMWMMLQHDKPDDFVIATGKTHSIKDFLEMAFGQVDLDWRNYVEIDQQYYRPTDVELLRGDATKARTTLGWAPEIDLEGLVGLMMEHDLELAQSELTKSENVQA